MAVLQLPVTQIDYLNFLQPFSYTVWLAYLASILACALCFYLFEHNSNEELVDAARGRKALQLYYRYVSGVPPPLLPRRATRAVTAAAAGTRSVWHVVLSFLGLDTGLRAATLAGRLLVVAMQFTALIVVATYTGSVASSLTAQVSLSAYSGIDDVKSGLISPMRVGVRPGTAQAAWYMNTVRPARSLSD